jgi:hypothetical protein
MRARDRGLCYPPDQYPGVARTSKPCAFPPKIANPFKNFFISFRPASRFARREQILTRWFPTQRRRSKRDVGERATMERPMISSTVARRHSGSPRIDTLLVRALVGRVALLRRITEWQQRAALLQNYESNRSKVLTTLTTFFAAVQAGFNVAEQYEALARNSDSELPCSASRVKTCRVSLCSGKSNARLREQ